MNATAGICSLDEARHEAATQCSRFDEDGDALWRVLSAVIDEARLLRLAEREPRWKCVVDAIERVAESHPSPRQLA